MHTTWIESPVQGRHGGPIRAGQWAFVVIGTHPVEVGQTVGLELEVNDVSLGYLPGYWLENREGNSYWHVPIPPLGIHARLRYQAVSHRSAAEEISRTHKLHAVVRPNPPRWIDNSQVVQDVPEGLIGNRRTTARIDSKASTYDVYYPSVALHSNVRPAEGDTPQSRTHFRGIVAGIAETRAIDWFGESTWQSVQSYEVGTNVLKTVLSHRDAHLRVIVHDMAIFADPWPDTVSGALTPCSYLKRYEIRNDSDTERTLTFALFVHAEINGGIGEPILSWKDGESALTASNAGHGHSNRKLARESTVCFVVALDDNGQTSCEPVGPTQAILTRSLTLAPRGSERLDVFVAGSFTSWQGDLGIFDHTLKPALEWFRGADLDAVEESTIKTWQARSTELHKVFSPDIPWDSLLQRSALTTLLHCDLDFGSVASGFDRGLNAYCRPREAMFTAEALGRLGLHADARRVFEWLESVRDKNPVNRFWFQKYSMDGVPEWETPSVDQSGLLPWALARHVRRSGETELYCSLWPAVKQAAQVMMGETGHPGLEWVDELSLIRSAGMWDLRFGCHIFGNSAAVAGLRAAADIAETIGESIDLARIWRERADRILHVGILGTFAPDKPGMVDDRRGHLRPVRRLNLRLGHWVVKDPSEVQDPDIADPGTLGPCIPLGLLPAEDERIQESYRTLHSDIQDRANSANAYRTLRHDIQVLTRLWMARYQLELAKRTGAEEALTSALVLFDGVVDALGPLGQCVGPVGGKDMQRVGQMMMPGVWGLHLQVCEFLTAMGGLSYDALDDRLSMQPVLPRVTQGIGARIALPAGWLRYSLRGEPSGRYALTMEWDLNRPLNVDVRLIMPVVSEAVHWRRAEMRQSEIPLPRMTWNKADRSMSWTETLASGNRRVVREWNDRGA
jgi:hypothetical protein